MKLGKIETVALMTVAGCCVNAVLMANGIETMPGMWSKEVYQNPDLATSIGGMSGGPLGAIAGVGLVTVSVIKDKVVSSINQMRNKTESVENESSVKIVL